MMTDEHTSASTTTARRQLVGRDLQGALRELSGQLFDHQDTLQQAVFAMDELAGIPAADKAIQWLRQAVSEAETSAVMAQYISEDHARGRRRNLQH